MLETAPWNPLFYYYSKATKITNEAPRMGAQTGLLTLRILDFYPGPKLVKSQSTYWGRRVVFDLESETGKTLKSDIFRGVFVFNAESETEKSQSPIDLFLGSEGWCWPTFMPSRLLYSKHQLVVPLTICCKRGPESYCLWTELQAAMMTKFYRIAHHPRTNWKPKNKFGRTQ